MLLQGAAPWVVSLGALVKLGAAEQSWCWDKRRRSEGTCPLAAGQDGEDRTRRISGHSPAPWQGAQACEPRLVHELVCDILAEEFGKGEVCEERFAIYLLFANNA